MVADAGDDAGSVDDVEYADAAEGAVFIPPARGGVGPTTTAVLLAQTLDTGCCGDV